MAIKRKKNGKFTVDLDGPDGNAMVLLGICKNLARQLEMEDKWTEISKEARSSDYKNLLKTLQKYFGKYVDFESENEDYFS